MKVIICFIGTQQYLNFFDRYYQTINTLFLPNTQKDFVVLTDLSYPPAFNNQKIINIEHKPWPYVTLLRFKHILKIEEMLKEYAWFIYVDADMYVNKVITEEEFFIHDKKFFGVQHPGYLEKTGTFENNRESTAYVSTEEDRSTYWQGCFWGGKIPFVVDMIKKLDYNISSDLNRGITALWHDESHLNKFYIQNKRDVYTYDCGYCFPEEYIKNEWLSHIDIKFIHLDKAQKTFPRFNGNVK